MPDEPPTRPGRFRVMEGADWSTSLNLRADSLNDAVLLSRIGQGLRDTYREMVAAPLPENLAVLIERLEQRDRRKA